MGSRGPQPTPTPILKARGSWLVNHRKNEPTPEPGRPTCPSWLPAEAKKIWRFVVPMIDRMGVLSRLDGAALERYCLLLYRWRKEAQFIEKHGTTYPVRRDGQVLFKLFPSVKVFDLLTTQLGRAEQAFGLTPASRSRISTQIHEEEEQTNDKRRFLRIG
jgi:P27 family predicted phage terminase small subunit